MKKDKKDKRFVRVYKEYSAYDTLSSIYVDKETGINYLMIRTGYGVGLTPLLNSDGKPMITEINDNKEI